MADNSKIEWTDATWNPVRGCSRVSEGCRNCYAEHQALHITRFDRGNGKPEGEGAYDGLVTLTSQGPKWTGQIREVMEKLGEPIRWKKPRRIFVNSMSDLFHEGVSDVFIADVFAAMAYARQHTFQVLTKRPQRMLQLLTSEAFAELYDQACGLAHEEACEVLGRRGEFSPHTRLTTDIRAMDPTLPRPNIWLGVSVEDQATADERIPLLLQTPAAVRFISAEPLLGPVDLTKVSHGKRWSSLHSETAFIDALAGGVWGEVPATGERLRVTHTPFGLDWVIAGGESRPKARPMHPEWVRGLRDQCKDAGVRFLFKQWGEWRPTNADYVVDDQQNVKPVHVFADRQRMAKVGKKTAGRLLDGVTHDAFPEGVRHGHD
jgi:protein gp37